MTKPVFEPTSEEIHNAALNRFAKTKLRMDQIQTELDQAEDEWHQACRALDQLENAE